MCAGLLAGLLPLLSLRTSAASSPWLLRSWLSDDGLPGNIVSGVAQTPNGYLWIAADGGLARFDGVRFHGVPLPRTPGKRSSVTRLMMRAPDGSLWLGTDGAAAVHVSEWGTVSETVTDGLPDSEPFSMTEDATGAIWMSFYDHSACRITGHHVDTFNSASGLPGGGLIMLTTDAQGKVWFAQGGHVGVFRDDRFQVLTSFRETSTRLAMCRDGGMWICAGLRVLKFQEGSEPVELGRIRTTRSANLATAMFEDSAGNLWIGTSVGGLFHYAHQRIEHVSTSHQEIQNLTEDREGDIWIGTGGGGLDRLRTRVLELQGTESGLPFESALSVCEDTEGGLWATTQSGSLVRWHGNSWTAVPRDAGWTGVQATCLAPDPQGGVWIGTRSHGLFHFANGQFTAINEIQGLADGHIRALQPGPAGDLWIGTDGSPSLQLLRGGNLTSFDLPPEALGIRAMAVDTAGDLWIGTRGGLLLHLKDGHLVDETPGNGSISSAIRCLHTTPDGALWIGYSGSGLGRIKNGHYAKINTAQGLLDGNISQMMSDDRGSFWFAGNRGIFQVWRSELDAAFDSGSRVRSIIYGRDEGLNSLQANYGYSPGALRSRDGRIWFLMRTGLAVMNADIVRDNPLPPQVVIEEMLVDGKPLPTSSAGTVLSSDSPPTSETTLRLPPDHHRLDFDYTALSFVAPENVHFRCRLEGVDEDWLDVGPKRSATYQRLAAGRYRFHVLACNNTGIWNETGAALSFIVEPFFWQTWWFRVSTVAVFTFSIVAIVRYVSFRRLREQLRTLEEQASLHRERARIAKDMHDDLGASITQIALLSELAYQDMEAPQKAGPHIQKITGTARQVVKSLDEIVWAVNPRNDTLAHLMDYAGQYALDFLRAPGIRCRLDFPEIPPLRTIPADVRHNLFLAIKEALHNIVKHSRASEVWLRVNATDRDLRITIEDNGCGFERPPQDAWADGLRNMRQRLAELGGECAIESHAGAGTKITFTLPWPGERS